MVQLYSITILIMKTNYTHFDIKSLKEILLDKKRRFESAVEARKPYTEINQVLLELKEIQTVVNQHTTRGAY
jgi:hypothetical protein